MEILQTLGIDWKLLIAQLVNFAILLFLLYRFLYRPLLGLMEKRSKTIEKSLENAQEIEERLKKTEAQRVLIIEEAKKEAAQLIEKAHALAERKGADMVEKAKGDVVAIVADAKRAIAQEKQQMLEDAKAQLGDLVVDAARAALQEGMEKSIRPELLEKAVAKVKAA